MSRRELTAPLVALALVCLGFALAPGAANPSPAPAASPSASPSTSPSPSASPTPPPEPSTAVEVDGAVFRWGVSNQSNARSHNPAAINFLAAGVADPGRGGATLKQSQWRAAAGAVTIEKRTGSGWRRATWPGLGTSPGGAPIGVYGPFSEHTVAIRSGSGTVDAAAGTASIAWQGTFTVVYYAGNSVFTVTDPRLDVADGRGSVTAVLGGFAADRDDTSSWEPTPPRRVTIADLPAVSLEELGFTAQPAYLGVRAQGSEPQDLAGEHAGAFPPSFVGYLRELGIDQFWYSTGLRSDETKPALPLSVSWSATEVTAPPPSTGAEEDPEVTNEVVAPPAGSPAPASPAPAAPAGAPVPPIAGSAAVPAPEPGLRQAPTNVALAAAPADSPRSHAAASGDGLWWATGLLLLAAALLLLVPQRRSSSAPATRTGS